VWLDRLRQRLLPVLENLSTTQYKKLFSTVRAANLFGIGNFDSLYTQTVTDLIPPVSFSLLFVPIPHAIRLKLSVLDFM
jgi:hypothetical protein